MEKSFDLKHIAMNDDNYQSESPAIPRTYNKYSSELGQLWSNTAHLYTTSSHTHKQIYWFNNHDTLDVHSPYYTPDQLIKTDPSTPLSSTCSSDFISPSYLAPFSQSIINSFNHPPTSSFNHPPTSSFSDPQHLPKDDDYAGPITYEIFMKQEQQQNKTACCCHLCQNARFSTSQSIINSFTHPPTSSFSDPRHLPEDDDYAGPITYEIFIKQEQQQMKTTCCCHLCENARFSTSQSIDTIPKESVEHQSNDLTTPSLPSSSPILAFRLLPSIPTNILKANRRLYRFPYRCSHPRCEKTFSKPLYLRHHEQRHLGIKPYSCRWPKCGWSFVRPDALARHYRTHTGIKPYSCKYCNRAFSRSDHFKKHMKSHFRN